MMGKIFDRVKKVGGGNVRYILTISWLWVVKSEHTKIDNR